MTTPVQVTVLSDWAAVGDLDRLAWTGHATQSGTRAALFQSLPWYENLDRFGIEPEHRRLLVRAQVGDGIPVALPLRHLPNASASVFGGALTGLANYYSSLYGPLGDAEGATVTCWRAVLRALRHQPGMPGVLDLQPLDTTTAFYTRFRAALEAEGWISDDYYCFGNWHLQVAGRRFDEYYETVPSRIRNTIRRARKKLDDTSGWHLRVLDGGESDLESAIRDWDTVYRKSWKVPEPFPDFVPNLIRTAARQGWLRLGVLYLGTTPLAAQLWLLQGSTALIYKLAYDEEYKRFSAGSVLSAELFRRVIDDDRVIEVDYLTGDDAYKADWMSHRRERRGLLAFDPRTAQGLLAAARHWAGKQVRRWRSRTPGQPAATARELAGTDSATT